MKKSFIPLAIFVVLVVFLWIGLTLNPREIPSPLLNKPAPAFKLVQLHEPNKVIAPEHLRGKVWLLNVWASWCATCLQEHPLLVEMARQNIVPIYGLNYKDQREAGMAWLRQHGNPYILSAHDLDGRVGIDYGVYGVPETYVIDKGGIIRYKHIGPITAEALHKTIIPLINELKKT